MNSACIGGYGTEITNEQCIYCFITKGSIDRDHQSTTQDGPTGRTGRGFPLWQSKQGGSNFEFECNEMTNEQVSGKEA